MCLLCTAVEVAYRNEKSGGKQEKIVTKEKKKGKGVHFPFSREWKCKDFSIAIEILSYVFNINY